MAKRKGSAGKPANTQAAVNQAANQSGGAPQAVAVAAAPSAAPTPKAAAATISRKEMLREAAIRKRQKQNLWLTIGGAVVVVLIGVAIYFGYRSSLPVVGETTFPTQGNLHIPVGSSPASPYNSTPPTSGPHYESIVPWGVQSEDVRYEYLVHNLEDAGVVVYYQCDTDCDDLESQLQAVVEPYISAGRHVVLTRNDTTWQENGVSLHKDMGARIALVAWRKLKLMDEVNADTIRTFIDKYEGIDHHQAGIG